ncbi:MAG: hypothetical protein LUD39_02900 [Opitutae bacterium]|nr:hypothetical protein [Opitutae bacterium]MCD8298693.1 hypothetical protein [Opitutae bacterium]
MKRGNISSGAARARVEKKIDVLREKSFHARKLHKRMFATNAQFFGNWRRRSTTGRRAVPVAF